MYYLLLLTFANVDQVSVAAGKANKEFFAVERPLIILTWITFLILAFILQKFVWKPVLTLLENRENSIKKALAEADRAKKFLEEAEEKKQKTIKEAETMRIEIVESAKKDAVITAEMIRKEAENTAAKILSDADRQIKAIVEKTRNELKIETGILAIEIAEKFLREKMDYDANKKMIENIIKEM